MAMVAGSVSVNGAGVGSGTGYAKLLYDALISEFGLSPGSVPQNVPGAQQQVAKIANAIASTLIPYVVANAVVSSTVASGIPVSTTGTAAAQTGATTSPGSATGTIA